MIKNSDAFLQQLKITSRDFVIFLLPSYMFLASITNLENMGKC